MSEDVLVNKDQAVTITLKTWSEIMEKIDLLDYLMAGGVDQWEGFELAQSQLKGTQS